MGSTPSALRIMCSRWAWPIVLTLTCSVLGCGKSHDRGDAHASQAERDASLSPDAAWLDANELDASELDTDTRDAALNADRDAGMPKHVCYLYDDCNGGRANDYSPSSCPPTPPAIGSSCDLD